MTPRTQWYSRLIISLNQPHTPAQYHSRLKGTLNLITPLSQWHHWLDDTPPSISQVHTRTQCHPLTRRHSWLIDTWTHQHPISVTPLTWWLPWFMDWMRFLTPSYPRLNHIPESMIHVTHWHPKLNNTTNSVTTLTEQHCRHNDTPHVVVFFVNQWHPWLCDIPLTR